MGTLTPQEDIAAARIKKFHSQLRHCCTSRALFKSKIRISIPHVAERASETLDDRRNTLSTGEVVGAVIVGGLLNEKLSNGNKPITVAIEAKLKNFKWVDREKQQEVTEKEICLRVVVREASPKHIVITVYPDRQNEIDPSKVPEVNHEGIW